MDDDGNEKRERYGDKRFRRRILLYKPPTSGEFLVLYDYRGDNTIAPSLPHGNAKKRGTAFLPALKSVIVNLKSAKDAPSHVYAEQTATARHPLEFARDPEQVTVLSRRVLCRTDFHKCVLTVYFQQLTRAYEGF